jgi:ABC-type multidrug transport system fused ATPase/permease subunit
MTIDFVEIIQSKSLLQSILALWKHVRFRRRIQIYGLIILYILSALSEAVSLATLIPFLTVLIDPTKFDSYVPSMALNLLPREEYRVIYIAAIYLTLVVFSGIIRLAALWANNHISFMLGADITRKIYAQTLNQPYSYFLGKNSSQLVDVMTKKSDALISGAIIPVLQSIGAFFYILIIVIVLLMISFETSFLLLFALTLIYSLLLLLTKKKAALNGLLISTGSSGLIKTIQEALQSKKDLIINQSHDYFVAKYHEVDIKLRRAESANQFLLHSPKIFLELLAIVSMVILAMIFLILEVNSSVYIPMLAVFALGAQRLLPSLQQIYAALSNVHARSSVLYEVIDILSLTDRLNQKINSSPFLFRHMLRLENICFEYPMADKKTLSHINLTIKKGDRLGIQGSSGSGKTTLVNLLLGLIEPTSGFIYSDNHKYLGLSHPNWYKNVSHVPQDVPMLDATVLENIAYGLNPEKIDVNDVRRACEMANILTDINLMPNGLMTLIGESGERLSGGQKQRIGIARALYKNSKVLILDEFTSALDSKTEREVVEIIGLLPKDITIIMVSHREQPLSICDRKIIIENGLLLF